jgi:2-amino-4-hydroxy-6-hydroxymethyldihydropteridine diphosphokinase
MAKLTTAYIGLGSNLGDRNAYIKKALNALAETKCIELSRKSNLIETAPLAGANQPKYLNAVAEIKTTLTARDLHKKMADIETSLGRLQKEKWAPRIIDLDLLLFGQQIINYSDLTVPHPQMHLRSFVLKGLCQLNPNLLHLMIKEPISELAARLNGCDFVPNPHLPQLVSVAGIIGVGKTTLAKKLSALLGSKLLLEPYDENPFLPDVYAGKEELALDSQLFFLTHRAEQLNHNTLVEGRIAITDYVFDKELIYARLLLDAQQLALYEEIYPQFSTKIVVPVLVIYLTDTVQNCLQRIHKRNRPYEQKIELKFLEALSRDYDRLFADWKTSPLIRKNMSDFNYTVPENIEYLANQIRSYVAV